MGRLQNEDSKSEAELISLGGTKANLLNTSKIYHQPTDQVLSDLIAALPNPAAGVIYVSGNETTNGSWRIRVDAGALKFEVRTAGTWTTKDTINP